MDPRVDAFSEAPTVTSTPILAARTPSPTSKEKGGNPGVILTATNTLDTLTLDEQNARTVVDEDEGVQPELAKTSTLRKVALLSMFTFAEFLDAFNNSALFPAIPAISEQLHFLSSETVWIISAYQLTFAAFLLVVSMPSPAFHPLLKDSPERTYIRCLHPKTSFHRRVSHPRSHSSWRWIRTPEDCPNRPPRSWWYRGCTNNSVRTLHDRPTISRAGCPGTSPRPLRNRRSHRQYSRCSDWSVAG
jgi:hypothetical protein